MRSFFYSFTGLENTGTLYFYLSIPLLIFGLVTLFLSYGLWTVQPWAWMWMVIVQGLGLFLEMVRLLVSRTPTYSGAAFSALGVLILVYMLTPQVRAAYLR